MESLDFTDLFGAAVDTDCGTTRTYKLLNKDAGLTDYSGSLITMSSTSPSTVVFDRKQTAGQATTNFWV